MSSFTSPSTASFASQDTKVGTIAENELAKKVDSHSSDSTSQPTKHKKSRLSSMFSKFKSNQPSVPEASSSSDTGTTQPTPSSPTKKKHPRGMVDPATLTPEEFMKKYGASSQNMMKNLV